MRSRNIKPGFFHNEELVECSFPARILFIGLWCLADREGYLEDRPKKIKIQVFPADPVDCEALLCELDEAALILRYEADGEKYIWIPGFRAHQNPHRREKPSEFPPHPDDAERRRGPAGEKTEQVPTKDRPRTDQDQAEGEPGHGRARLNPDILNPDILNPETNTPQPPSGGQGDKSPEDPPLKPEFSGRVPQVYHPDFERFWAEYPMRGGKKGSKRKAFEAWWRAMRDGLTTPEKIIADIVRLRASYGEFPPDAVTWINGRRWEDEVSKQTLPTPIPRGKPNGNIFDTLVNKACGEIERGLHDND